MRAKEYYAKYIPKLFPGGQRVDIETATKLVVQIAVDFLQEITPIAELRHVSTEQGYFGIFRELNQKWNALANMFIENGHGEILRHDGLVTLCISVWKESMNEPASRSVELTEVSNG